MRKTTLLPFYAAFSLLLAPRLALGVGLAGASTVGFSRVLAGQNFPTDVLAGAVLGSALGVLVPSLHGRKVTIVPQITKDSAGVSFLRAF